jgi:hypothetical protein
MRKGSKMTDEQRARAGRPRANLTGHRSGRLVIVMEAPGGIARKRRLMAWCDCGRPHAVRIDAFTHGQVRSCGCDSSNARRRLPIGERNEDHPLYSVWCAMRDRCRHHRHYAGRGIAVCARWGGSDGFRNFVADMGERPLGTSIDRTDNDGDYEPSNCRWATSTEQNRNRRKPCRSS